jgi:hypothetical protein
LLMYSLRAALIWFRNEVMASLTDI